MEVKIQSNSVFSSATYRVGRVLVDPGDLSGLFEGVDAVLLTHGHFDHIYGINEVVSRNPDVRIYTNEYGARMLQDIKLNMSKYHEPELRLEHPENVVVIKEGDTIREDGMEIRVYETPGHNPSCVTYALGELLFTGDSYVIENERFAADGRQEYDFVKTVANLPHSDKRAAAESERRIRELAEGRRILPGHRL